MNENHIKTLQDFGLSAHEAGVYYAGLLLGPTTVLKISKLSGVKRTSIYAITDALKNKGLMSIQLKGLKQLFVAENPDRLKNVIDQKQQALQYVLPEFQKMFQTRGDEGGFKYYEGLSAVKQIYLEILKELQNGDEYCAITNHGTWLDLDPIFFEKFIEKRAKLPITIRLLFEENTRGKEHKKFEKNFNEQIRILPIGTTLDTNIVITPKKILMHTLSGNITGVVLTNKSFIKMQKEFFEIMWNSSNSQ